MQAFLCTTCGTQYPPSESPPPRCPICEDERQYLQPAGQGWTTLPRLRITHMNAFRDEAGLLGIGTAPHFAIGQRALLVPTPAGNVLWDCISLIDRATVEIIRGLGGLAAIAISHPHYYTTMLEWSEAFGGVPIHLHAADRDWIMRDGPAIALWEGDTKEIAPGLTLIRCGGHFAGGTVAHWTGGAAGRGALLSGDILQVVADRRTLGFMRSYPNFIPLGAAAVRRIAGRVAPWRYDAILGAFWDKVIPHDAEAAMRHSVERHIHWLGDPPE
ncbi:MBL fold metallo-hydrolase [Roseomonas sp. NAR14]|uniref:MBL fold metallo-hydrolase n=1 Tax=Roseomonas acroporae TaxID=2937791 RepID=A0A9X1YBH4_9PROT|nr:MBL fold metallo-hydrolase [Roseomonas acroporae]MCK8787068.1 MBL fold metallo-hydrolase [Roseomonas acroporae]